jgi:stalled ribosome rescue protein Dom34
MSHTQHGQHTLRQMAVWIDHREAILAIFEDAHLLSEEEIFSEVDPHTHGGGWAQKRIEAHRHTVLDHYYEEVVQNLAGADEIIIYGPGQAKYELHQHINRNRALSQRVIDLVTTDKLSEHQLVHLAVNDLISAHVGQTK